MRNIVILGSTGSIGRQTLDIVRMYPKEFRVIGLSTKSNRILLAQQKEEFNVKYTSVTDDDGPGRLLALAQAKETQIVVNALSGLCGIEPTVAAIVAQKQVLIANKETLVAGWRQIQEAEAIAAVTGDEKFENWPQIIPIDSEHSAIFQLLDGQRYAVDASIERIILTCSGGPFYGKTKKELKEVTPEQALSHPRWDMGRKISVDSATLMNKGFEIIEAANFFNFPIDRIDVVIHPESIVHAIVEFPDGQFFAHMAPPDMRHMIAYALFYSDRKKLPLKKLSFQDLNLHFEKPDEETFITLPLARKAAGIKGAPWKLVETDEKAVEMFLKREISFLEIFDMLKSSI